MTTDALDPPPTLDPLPLDDRPPLRVTEGGAVRVGAGRITLDLVVEQYENGVTPEDMVDAYDTLVLADVYAVVGYYLRHRDAVRTYMHRRAVAADALRAKIEAERPPTLKATLLERRRTAEANRAAAGQ